MRLGEKNVKYDDHLVEFNWILPCTGCERRSAFRLVQVLVSPYSQMNVDCIDAVLRARDVGVIEWRSEVPLLTARRNDCATGGSGRRPAMHRLERATVVSGSAELDAYAEPLPQRCNAVALIAPSIVAKVVLDDRQDWILKCC